MTITEAFEENQGQSARPSRSQYWSETVRQKHRRNPLPIWSFLLGLIPGLIIAGILAVPFFLLELESQRNIAYFAVNGNLELAQAKPDLENSQIINTPPEQTATIARLRVNNMTPLPGLATMGLPQWSAEGVYLAATTFQENGTQRPTIFDKNFHSFEPLKSPNDILAAPADGWSKEGNVIALVESDGTRPLLTLVGPPFNSPVFFDFTLDTRAGLAWNPQTTNLLVTGYTPDLSTPNLLLVNTSSTEPRVFTPKDGLSWHADGVWSPNSEQIAYIAGDVYTTTQDILAGQLWVVSSDGSGARRLGPHHRVLAPVWSPNSDAIYYTRFFAPSGMFSLYRININVSATPQYIGPSSEDVLRLAWDRSLLFQWSPDDSQLLFVGQDAIPPDYYTNQEPSLVDFGLAETSLPILGAAYLSPDKQKFAGTIITADGVQGVIYTAPDSSPTLTPVSDDEIAIPADGWSSNSDFVAMLRADGANTRLAVMDTTVTDPPLVTSQLVLDLRAGMRWHPTADQLMVTTVEAGITPTLRFYNPANDTSIIFSPPDNQVVRGDGAWSPNGNQVVYVAHETLTPTLDMPFLAGPLWIATATGQVATPLVQEGLNFAPIWDRLQDRILFTRYIPETDRYVLFQVSPNGSGLEKVGPSSEAFAQYPFDRQYFYRWSPEGRLWALYETNTALPFIYYRLSNELVSTLDSGCKTSELYAVRWSPTNRGVLVACPTGDMFLRWLDSDRDDKPYPAGLFPIWQP